MDSFFFGMPAELMTTLSAVIGFAWLGDLTAEQQNSLGNFLMMIGQVLVTNAGQLVVLESDVQTSRIAALEEQLAAIRLELDRMKEES